GAAVLGLPPLSLNAGIFERWLQPRLQGSPPLPLHPVELCRAYMANPRHITRANGADKPTVLIVEDVVLVRLLLADLLRERGFEVIEAATAEDAVRVLKADFPVRLVLSDVYMPGSGMDGVALARWVHEHRPGLKVILGSGVVSNLDAADA